jgi:hypothetical protein
MLHDDWISVSVALVHGSIFARIPVFDGLCRNLCLKASRAY